VTAGTPLDVRKLRLIAARFVSNHEGERLAALTLANRMLSEAGLGWGDLLKADAEPPDDELVVVARLDPRRAVRRMLGQRGHELTAWEHDFLDGVSRFLRLSDKQLDVIQSIAQRLADVGAP
jgi:hypothetical protein